MMPPCGTFNYFTVVPSGGAQASPWRMESNETFVPTGSHLTENRLVGWNPMLHICDAGVTPNPGPTRPAVLRSELRFVSQGKKYAQTSSACYYLDRVLMDAVRPGDVFHMARTLCGGLGVSALRQNNLIFAAGAISAVPLGSRIQAKIAGELILAAEKIFRPHYPLKFATPNHARFFFRVPSGEMVTTFGSGMAFIGVCPALQNASPFRWMGHATTRPYVRRRNSWKFKNNTLRT